MKTKPLKGRKVLVTAYDLEQKEHRGIAVYTKSLIRCLQAAGAEVWLLTEYFDKSSKKELRNLPKNTQKLIRNSRILNSLALGKVDRPMTALERKNKYVRKARIIIESYIILLRNLLLRPRTYRLRNLERFYLQDLYDNPYIRISRLDYLQDVTGIVSAPEIYLGSQLAAQLQKLRPVRIDLRGFDAFITTCPLNIKPLNVSTFIQTIHDLIPLEYVAHNEDPLIFSHRLQACLAASKLFVSQSSANKYNIFVRETKKPLNFQENNDGDDAKGTTIIQSPSLMFSSRGTDNESQTPDLRPATHLLRGNSKKSLTPFKYFLFNSSVEARKNLLFLAKAYSESNLYSEGIQLCVTGKLKKDEYSKALKKIVTHEPGIILTDYIDESAKIDLYLNALGLLSPSLVEGFGIPVLDSACLGLPTVASNCESHLEIQSLHDFRDHVQCLNTIDSREWGAALQMIANNKQGLADQPVQTRRQRISRYYRFQSIFTNQLQENLVTLLN